MLEWLFLPIDPSRAHYVDFSISWHGRLMVLAWGVMIPIAIIIARFFKVSPKQAWPEELDNKFWWHSHRYLQYSAAISMALATLLILYGTAGVVSDSFHPKIGWVVLSLTVSQIASGLLRGSKGGPTDPATDGSLFGDHYNMTQRRVVFEYYHKCLGYLLCGLSLYTISTGMWIANAPNWMWIGLAAWLATLVIVFSVLQRGGRCLDTYQAIWGMNKDLPGNKKKPIGLGICKDRHPWR